MMETKNERTVISLRCETTDYYTEHNNLPEHSLTVEFDATDAVLGDVVAQVEYFLKAQGYTFDHLEIVHTERVTEFKFKANVSPETRYTEGYADGYREGYETGCSELDEVTKERDLWKLIAEKNIRFHDGLEKEQNIC